MTDKTLRSKLIRLAKAQPELREHLLPLLEKKAGYGEYPKVYGHTHASHKAGVLWLWTSFAGFGRAHDLSNNVKYAEKMLVAVKERFTAHFDDDISWWEASDVTFAATKSNPREMVGTLRLSFENMDADSQTPEESFPNLRGSGLAGWKQQPK